MLTHGGPACRSHNYDEDQDFGMQGNLFNRMSGRVSVGEALGSAPMVESALLELKRSGMVRIPPPICTVAVLCGGCARLAT